MSGEWRPQSWEEEAPDGAGCYEGAVDLAVGLLGEGIDSLDGRALAARLADVERAIRRLGSVAVSIVATADRRDVFREDGHVSVSGWVKASVRLSDVEVTHRARCARLVNRAPLWGAVDGDGSAGGGPAP